MKGYILLSRGIQESDIWSKPPLYLKVWVYLLRNAQYQDYGSLKRGQLFTSIPEIQEACAYKVGYRTETPSSKQIWGILDWLRKPHEGETNGKRMGSMIETTKVTQGMIVTICNYNKYQEPKYYESNNESNNEKETNGKRTEEKGNNKKNTYKELNNKKIIIDNKESASSWRDLSKREKMEIHKMMMGE